MSSGSVNLSAATRTNLLSLQRTTGLIDRTQSRLSTGKKVNSAIDDAMAFFTARNLNNRASDLNTLKDGIKEGISQISTAISTLESIEDVLSQMKAVASSAKSTDAADSSSRETLRLQFNDLRSQIDHLTDDSVYNGVNLVKDGADTLTVKFSEASDSRALTIAGIASDSSALSVHSAGGAAQGTGAAVAGAPGWASEATYVATITTAMSEVDSALSTVRTTAQTFGSNASLLEIRKEFTENLVNTLTGGASDLVNADLNEESANMLALQTRQQLGTIALSMAQQSQQGVLRLF